ncbi:CHAT domain-containing protein [Russula dissimulans]|nr:CHAT domain-containing protein [Russula dissimulans]
MNLKDPQGALHALDNYLIPLFKSAVLSCPLSHPLRVLYVQSMARARFQRYTFSGQQDDLEQSILHYTEAILYPLPWDEDCRSITQIFFQITFALACRARGSKQPADVECSLSYIRYLRGLPPEAHDIEPALLKEVLLGALGNHADLELGDVMLDIEEMSDLCHDHLLNFNASQAFAVNAIKFMAQTVSNQLLKVEWQGPSEKVFRCLREANTRLPEVHLVSIVLARCLFCRFKVTHSNEDHEEGTGILEQVIAFRGPGDRKSQYHDEALFRIATAAHSRLTIQGKPEIFEQAISRARTYLSRASLEHPGRPEMIKVLAGLQLVRSRYFGFTRGDRDARSRILEILGRPSFWDLSASLARSSGSTFSGAMVNKYITAVQTTYYLTDIADIENAIEFCRLLRATSHLQLARHAAMALGHLLPGSFERTDNIEHLNEAISVLRGILDIPASQVHFVVLRRLIQSLLTRFGLLYHKEDLDDIVQLSSMAVNHTYGMTPDRFKIAWAWACLARISEHPSIFTAYDCALSLMQDSLVFSPTLDIQHSRLVEMGEGYDQLPLDYASYQVHTGQLQQAIETLERGRALIWSEMRGLRTSIDRIRAANSHLADDLATVNRELETLTLTVSSESGADGGLEEVDSFGHLVMQQRKLLDDRDKIILQIRALPGFETFLKAPSFDALRFAAVCGPVIIINHSKWRSDILILLHSSPPSLIETPDDFYDRANQLQNQLFGARKDLNSKVYEDTLKSVLKDLYELVGRPVIQRLKRLNIPDQSRVWWCPTSVFCSLPLHAMGPVQSDVGPPQYFLDLYIPSYTPTLSTLIEAHRPGMQTYDKPSILLVVQPDHKLPNARQEMRTIQAVSPSVSALIWETATPPAVLEHLEDHRFAHVVCHGILEPGRPLDSWFKLYGGARLSLLDVVRSRLSRAEFAFLSVCHTAELTDGSLADEVLHLTAAMQYCGFRSVVGTMWAMADRDGPILAEHFYRSVFSGEKGRGVCHYERTAKALRDAVIKLRGTRGIEMTTERWVNFVHYGA